MGPLLAATILGELRGGSLPHSKAFAMLNGTAPVAASSGKVIRHRLNRRGNRRLNWALHMMAVNCLRFDEATKAYVARKTAEGMSKKEAIRCLKRHLSNVVFRQLSRDLEGAQVAA